MVSMWRDSGRVCGRGPAMPNKDTIVVGANHAEALQLASAIGLARWLFLTAYSL